jgi:hypothetical protein
MGRQRRFAAKQDGRSLVRKSTVACRLGLSNTCPQTGARRNVVAMLGQVSNKPK